MSTIRNPIEWSADQLDGTAKHLGKIGRSLRGEEVISGDQTMQINRITTDDLVEAINSGIRDFAACRTDVMFLCLFYPVIGALLAWSAFGYDMLPLIFPVVSGFALVGPIAAVGLYEMSRQREQGIKPSWGSALGLVNSPSFGAILILGFGLLAIFIVWIGVAAAIYNLTLGPDAPESVPAFLRDLFFTGAGWSMSMIGIGVGLIFALLVLAISVVSFPLLLDHNVGLRAAVTTSLRVFMLNFRTILSWGGIIAAALVLGMLPLFLGLIFIMPILGHATWHLYRRVITWK